MISSVMCVQDPTVREAKTGKNGACWPAFIGGYQSRYDDEVRAVRAGMEAKNIHWWGLSTGILHDKAINSQRDAETRDLRETTRGVCPVARNHQSGSGSSELGMVEAPGVEPGSEDLQYNGSTCVADRFNFAATHAHRLA